MMNFTRRDHILNFHLQQFVVILNQYTIFISGPCKNNTECAAKSAECVVENGEAICECPTCDNVEPQPVCGYVVVQNKEPNLRTWPSACELQKDACQRGLGHEVYDIENCHGKIYTK